MDADVDPRRAPLAVLDLQLELWRWAKSSAAGRIERLHQAAQRPVAPGDLSRYPGWADTFADSVLTGLDGMTLWVGADVSGMIEQVAATIPAPNEGAIGAGTVMAPAGTVWVAGDPILLGLSEPVVAVSWSVQPWPLQAAATSDVELVPAVVLWPWSPGHRPELLPQAAVPLALDALSMLDPEDLAGISTPGRMVWDPEQWASDAMALVRWMLAVWVFAGQVLPQHIVSAGRPARRRAARLLPQRRDWGDVHIATLRRAGHAGGGLTAAGDGPAWSHRWVVRGHWRWQPCGPGRRDRRLTWIAPHVKGPEGAPLTEVEQVAKLVR